MNSPPAPADSVRARRAKVARYTLLANRVGYLCVGVAVAVFVIGFAISFNGLVAAVVIGALALGFVLLAPSIVLGYGIKAAERDDAERGL